MSTNTSTPDTSTTEAAGTPTIDADHHHDRFDGGEQHATDHAATAGDRLWAALHARPGGTAEELSADAGIGRSTAAKILARWVAEGTAARVPTDGKRSASRYAVPAHVDGTPPGDAGDTPTAPREPHSAPQTVDLGTDPGTSGDTVDETGGEGHQDRDDGTATIEDAAPGAVDDGAANRTDIDPPASAPESDHAADAVTADVPDDDDLLATPVTVSRGPRLAPGALHGMVEDYLRDHPDGDFGPTKIGHELGRSTGAVGNALERLVTAGYAVRTNDRPKRYALATSATADRDTAEDGGA